MAIALDPVILDALDQQSHDVGILVQAQYGAAQTVPSEAYPGIQSKDWFPALGLPVTEDGSLTFSASGQIQANGSVYVGRDGGDSLVPKTETDPLAARGQELTISYLIRFGDETAAIPLGVYRITGVPDPREYFRRFPSQERVVGWLVQVNIADRFEQIVADDFLTTTGPTPGNSTWDEIRALSPIPIVQSLPDQPIPAGIVYQGRFDAITQLMANLGGEPHLTRQGALTARVKDRWLTADSDDPDFVINGTTDLQTGMSLNIINSVVITNPNDAKLVGRWQIDDESNPRAVTRPIGRRTYTQSNPLMTTQTMIDQAAQTTGERLSARESETASFTCLPRPDLELGDCGFVVDAVNRRRVFGEIMDMTVPLDPLQQMSGKMTVAFVESIAEA